LLPCAALGYRQGVPTQLTNGEASTWAFIQRLSELAHAVVEQEVRASADLTAAEFDVLRLLLDAAEPMRQSEIAAALTWDKSRLSHQLTRMEQRGLLERRKSGRIHAVRVTREGMQRLELAGSAHAAAVRALLLEHLSTDERRALESTALLQADEPEHPAPAPRQRRSLRVRAV
jgi:DNA-binding MarR family transcriptional regulator